MKGMSFVYKVIYVAYTKVVTKSDQSDRPTVLLIVFTSPV